MKGGYTMGNETKYTLDNIQEFFDSLDNAPNSKIRKMMVWDMNVIDCFMKNCAISKKSMKVRMTTLSIIITHIRLVIKFMS